MISSAPFRRLLVELNLSVPDVSKILTVDEKKVFDIYNEIRFSPEVIEEICKVLDVQPCDIVRYESPDGLKKIKEIVSVLSDSDKQALKNWLNKTIEN